MIWRFLIYFVLLGPTTVFASTSSNSEFLNIRSDESSASAESSWQNLFRNKNLSFRLPDFLDVRDVYKNRVQFCIDGSHGDLPHFRSIDPVKICDKSNLRRACTDWAVDQQGREICIGEWVTIQSEEKCRFDFVRLRKSVLKRVCIKTDFETGECLAEKRVFQDRKTRFDIRVYEISRFDEFENPKFLFTKRLEISKCE